MPIFNKIIWLTNNYLLNLYLPQVYSDMPNSPRELCTKAQVSKS